MSIRSKLSGLFSKPKEAAATPAGTEPHASRHERREAGRKRHHQTGEPAWEASDKIDHGSAEHRNPDAAPEILGGG